MSYVLHAVIAHEKLLRTATQNLLPDAQLASLRQGFALLPLTNPLFDAITDGTATPDPLGFPHLPGGFAHHLAHWSTAGAVAYVEADYFGGTGDQRAAVWAHGTLTLGPLHTSAHPPFPATSSPISHALHRLGATPATTRDEFHTVGLHHHHRHTDDWLI